MLTLKFEEKTMLLREVRIDEYEYNLKLFVLKSYVLKIWNVFINYKLVLRSVYLIMFEEFKLRNFTLDGVEMRY